MRLLVHNASMSRLLFYKKKRPHSMMTDSRASDDSIVSSFPIEDRPVTSDPAAVIRVVVDVLPLPALVSDSCQHSVETMSCTTGESRHDETITSSSGEEPNSSNPHCAEEGAATSKREVVAPPTLRRRYLPRRRSKLALQYHDNSPRPIFRSNNKKRWLIPADHPFKVAWDILTFLLSIVNVYATHTAIRDRQFLHNHLIRICELFFMLDIVLNFFTERTLAGGKVLLTTPRTVWARYLTSWFVVDVLSLVPFEVLYIQPIIERQNRRGFFQKSFFRTKAVVRVTRLLRQRHFKLFGAVAKQTSRAGVGANRLLRLIIKYVPKYLLFLRNMKAVVAVRALRQVHWVRNVWNKLRHARTTVLVVDDDNDDENDELEEFEPHSFGSYPFDDDDEEGSQEWALDDSRDEDDWQVVEEERHVDDDDDDDDDGDPY